MFNFSFKYLCLKILYQPFTFFICIGPNWVWGTFKNEQLKLFMAKSNIRRTFSKKLVNNEIYLIFPR